MIKIINNKDAENIINKRIPKGLFLIFEHESYTGIDNKTGDAWVEQFENLKNCLKWLGGYEINE